MNVVTRFAPSPTGFLHLGGARTALFNWLYARHHGGKFLLRVEDTDRARSTDEAIAAIYSGLEWLGLDWDGEAVHQFQQRDRHAEVAQSLLAAGNAYYCYTTPEELKEMREAAREAGKPPRYDGHWRDRDPSEAPDDVAPAVRFKAPREGETLIDDQVQGQVRTANDHLDDMVLLRGDGTPTYMLSVVVDDHDMGISHVIRGVDHLTNAARQAQLYLALGWEVPVFAHIPLIHGPDGAKLSKRHGALGVEAYRDMGYLAETMCNYLLRLGWGHGDDEIITRDQAIEWFDLGGVVKSPARFDLAKMESLNGHYMREADDEMLAAAVADGFKAEDGSDPNESTRATLLALMPELKQRSKTLLQLIENSRFCVMGQLPELDSKASKLLDNEARALLGQLLPVLQAADDWAAGSLETSLRDFADAQGIGFGKVAQPLRAALTGRTVSPGIFDVLAILGRDESLARVGGVAKQ